MQKKIRNLIAVLLTFFFIDCSDENPANFPVDNFKDRSSSSSLEFEKFSCSQAVPSSYDIAESSSSSILTSSSSKTLSSNSSSISYGELIDERDGHVYKTVKIGKQTWMAENLNYAYTQPVKIASKTIDSASFCYNNEPDSCAKYGRLYAWKAAVDCVNESINSRFDENFKHRGICPENWHIPSINEWETLIEESHFSAIDLRSSSGWLNGFIGSDTFGFNSLPAGLYDVSGSGYSHISYSVLWGDEEWDPTESAGKVTCYGTHRPWTTALDQYISCNDFEGYEAVCFSRNRPKPIYLEEMENIFAFSVRCIKDSTEAE